MKQKDIVAWQTKRKINKSKEHRLINNKLYDLNKKKFLKVITPPTSEDIKQIKKELKTSRLNKNRNFKKVSSNITDKQYYSPIIIKFLKEHNQKAYTFDTIAKRVNYKIIDKEDKKYFINIIEALKKLHKKDIDCIRYYYMK